MRRKKTNREFQKEIEGMPFVALEEYAGAMAKILFKCSVDGHEWRVKPNHILGGSGCPVCSALRGAEALRGTNAVLESHEDWLLVDISTPTHPKATMAIDTAVLGCHVESGRGRIFATIPRTSKYIYAGYHVGSKNPKIHHDVLPLKTGFDTDHIKHGTLSFVDNRRSNLRRVTSSQNHMNHDLQTNNTSGTAGVSWDKSRDRWSAYIKAGSGKVHLGRFDNKADAIAARKQAEKEYFGEFAFSG